MPILCNRSDYKTDTEINSLIIVSHLAKVYLFYVLTLSICTSKFTDMDSKEKLKKFVDLDNYNKKKLKKLQCAYDFRMHKQVHENICSH